MLHGVCMDMHKSYSRLLLFPQPSGFGLWDRVSSVVRQRKGKLRTRAFVFRDRRFRFRFLTNKNDKLAKFIGIDQHPQTHNICHSKYWGTVLMDTKSFKVCGNQYEWFGCLDFKLTNKTAQTESAGVAAAVAAIVVVAVVVVVAPTKIFYLSRHRLRHWHLSKTET